MLYCVYLFFPQGVCEITSYFNFFITGGFNSSEVLNSEVHAFTVGKMLWGCLFYFVLIFYNIKCPLGRNIKFDINISLGKLHPQFS